MQGNKTHEQMVKNLERKDGPAKARDQAANGEEIEHRSVTFSSGERTSHTESRDHNKHNNPGQAGHTPQKHTPAEEKQE